MMAKIHPQLFADARRLLTSAFLRHVSSNPNEKENVATFKAAKLAMEELCRVRISPSPKLPSPKVKDGVKDACSDAQNIASFLNRLHPNEASGLDDLDAFIKEFASSIREGGTRDNYLGTLATVMDSTTQNYAVGGIVLFCFESILSNLDESGRRSLLARLPEIRIDDVSGPSVQHDGVSLSVQSWVGGIQDRIFEALYSLPPSDSLLKLDGFRGRGGRGWGLFVSSLAFCSVYENLGSLVSSNDIQDWQKLKDAGCKLVSIEVFKSEGRGWSEEGRSKGFEVLWVELKKCLDACENDGKKEEQEVPFVRTPHVLPCLPPSTRRGELAVLLEVIESFLEDGEGFKEFGDFDVWEKGENELRAVASLLVP